MKKSDSTALSHSLPPPAAPHVVDKGNPDACAGFRAGGDTQSDSPHIKMGFYSVSAIKFAILCWDFYSPAARGRAVIQTPGQLLLFVCLFSPLISSTFLILDIKNVFDTRPVPVSQFSCRLLKSERDAAVRASADETLQKVGVPPPPPSFNPPTSPIPPSLQTTRVDQLRCGAGERPSLLWDDRKEKAGHEHDMI